MSAAPAPYGWLFETLILDTIKIVAPVLQGITDEVGNAISVPMRSVYNARDVVLPCVIVSIDPGGFNFEVGESITALSDDLASQDANGWAVGVQRAVYARGSRINFEVRAANDPMRRFVADALLSGILTSWTTNPTSGELIQFAVPKMLDSIGVTAIGFDAVRYPPSDLRDDRPEGQPYIATISMRADVWLMWVTPTVAVPEVDIDTVTEVSAADATNNVTNLDPTMVQVDTPHPTIVVT